MAAAAAARPLTVRVTSEWRPLVARETEEEEAAATTEALPGMQASDDPVVAVSEQVKTHRKTNKEEGMTDDAYYQQAVEAWLEDNLWSSTTNTDGWKTVHKSYVSCALALLVLKAALENVGVDADMGIKVVWLNPPDDGDNALKNGLIAATQAVYDEYNCKYERLWMDKLSYHKSTDICAAISTPGSDGGESWSVGVARIAINSTADVLQRANAALSGGITKSEFGVLIDAIQFNPSEVALTTDTRTNEIYVKKEQTEVKSYKELRQALVKLNRRMRFLPNVLIMDRVVPANGQIFAVTRFDQDLYFFCKHISQPEKVLSSAKNTFVKTFRKAFSTANLRAMRDSVARHDRAETALHTLGGYIQSSSAAMIKHEYTQAGIAEICNDVLQFSRTFDDLEWLLLTKYSGNFEEDSSPLPSYLCYAFDLTRELLRLLITEVQRARRFVTRGVATSVLHAFVLTLDNKDERPPYLQDGDNDEATALDLLFSDDVRNAMRQQEAIKEEMERLEAMIKEAEKALGTLANDVFFKGKRQKGGDDGDSDGERDKIQRTAAMVIAMSGPHAAGTANDVDVFWLSADTLQRQTRATFANVEKLLKDAGKDALTQLKSAIAGDDDGVATGIAERLSRHFTAKGGEGLVQLANDEAVGIMGHLLHRRARLATDSDAAVTISLEHREAGLSYFCPSKDQMKLYPDIQRAHQVFWRYVSHKWSMLYALHGTGIRCSAVTTQTVLMNTCKRLHMFLRANVQLALLPEVVMDGNPAPTAVVPRLCRLARAPPASLCF